MLVFEHVSKVYGNGTKALDDVSLRIDDGEFVLSWALRGGQIHPD